MLITRKGEAECARLKGSNDLAPLFKSSSIITYTSGVLWKRRGKPRWGRRHLQLIVPRSPTILVGSYDLSV